MLRYGHLLGQDPDPVPNPDPDPQHFVILPLFSCIFEVNWGFKLISITMMSELNKKNSLSYRNALKVEYKKTDWIYVRRLHCLRHVHNARIVIDIPDVLSTVSLISLTWCTLCHRHKSKVRKSVYLWYR
jgi:hypothetical protein